MIKKTIDGNEAAAHSAYMFSEVAGIYPITPSSPMAEHVDVWSGDGVKNIFNDSVKVIEMQSEAGAAGLVHGSLQAGALTTTFTASQGLLLMIPNMYKISGEMLPGVFHVAARSLSTHALSIFGDHQDIYAVRQTGFCMLSSSSVKEASDMAIISHLSAIKASLPFMHFFDGFRTSHELNDVELLEKSDIEHLIDREAIKAFRDRALNPLRPYTIGTAQNDDIYFQNTEVRNSFYNRVPDIVANYMEEINKIGNTDYKPFNYYGDKDATKVIVAMGSVCSTVKETIDDLNFKGEKLGLITVHLYRPFSSKHLLNVIPDSAKKVAVLDRTKEPGSVGEPLYLDVKSVLTDRVVVGGRYGLSGKNTTPRDIKAVFDMLDEPKDNFTISIIDDVTNLSLVSDKNYKIGNSEELLIYGFGSDGMVSASKSLIKLIGNNSDKHVQGYFQYDSKKSGGVTISHMRFSSDKINSTYYCERPSLIVVTKDKYLEDFDILDNILESGSFILNTTMTEEEFLNSLSRKNYDILKNRNINVYLINSLELAMKVGLKNRISTVMQSVIMNIFGILDYSLAKEEMIKYAKIAYFDKGEEIFNANKRAIEEASNYLRKIELKDIETNQEERRYNTFFEQITHRKGYEIPVSKFNPAGIFTPGTSSLEKRDVSEFVPVWNDKTCVMCNQCSINCPHGVIRPFLLSEEEYELAPEHIKEKCKKPFQPNLKDYYYYLGISVKDCTGCGLCESSCKIKEKAITLEDLTQEEKDKTQEVFDYLDKNVTDKSLNNKFTPQTSQYKKPKFLYSGACAGCGETNYLKILTQLYGDNLIISNATGCSSIYGGSAPVTPYTIPWASSLFEDNAEYGYGMLIANNVIRKRLFDIIKNMNSRPELLDEWLENYDNYEVTKRIYDTLDYSVLPKDIVELKDYLVARKIITVGGDGWAYDIGFSGIDHVLSSNDDVNILVLDSEVYSNTGGQSSKASPIGSVASFTSFGKKVAKKDLAKIAMAYPNAYVAQTSLGYNQMQTINCFKEALNHKGPSIIIAYSPCISHGIKGGMVNSIKSSKEATECGYFPTFRYNPVDKKLTLDSKNVDFDKYEEFLLSQNRYKILDKINETKAKNLMKQNKENAKERFEFYEKKSLEV